MNTNYHLITEHPGQNATYEQIARLYHRYHFAADYAMNNRVLEVACGSGLGLGYLASTAKHVTGGDIDERNVAIANDFYKNYERINVVLLDAQNLLYPDQSFELVLLYEAIYYLQAPEKFVSQTARILRKSGLLIICTVNKDWTDFHPSPFTQKYFSVPELYQLLMGSFREINMYGAFPAKSEGFISGCVSLLKRGASRFHLIPASLAARAYLKRIFLGPLQPLPKQIEAAMADYAPPIPLLHDKSTGEFKIIYAVARK